MKITPVASPHAVNAAVEASKTAQAAPRRIPLQTNYTIPPNQPPGATEATSAPVDTAEQSTPAETKPIDPQFADLARHRRALQVKERELAQREKALAAQPQKESTSIALERLKAEPLSVLQEAGVTYDQLTEALLSGQNSPEIQALKAELKALKEGVDTKLSERDTRDEEIAFKTIQSKVDSLVESSADTYEAIKATSSQSQVLDLIKQVWKTEGLQLSEKEACELVEAELVKDAIKYASLGKVQKQLAPTAEVPQQRQMRTLTSRDSAAPVLDRKARARAAFYGK